jgi:hypothetical protein
MKPTRRARHQLAADPRRRLFDRSIPKWVIAALFVAVATLTSASDIAWADEGGLSFWLPGLFGSLAAAPQVPGWAAGIVYYHPSVSAAGNVAAAREVTIGKLNPTINVNLNLSMKASADLVVIDPSYTFATPVFGGQFNINVAGFVGRDTGQISGTLTATSGPFVATRQGSISDSLTSVGDLIPQMSLRWNSGVNNWMVYGMGDIPVGNYNSANLANLGLGHGAGDVGAGYTYFDQKTGHEFSVVTGFTYNLLNPSTGYQNGVDWHVDWGASQFFTKQLQLGAVGYFFQQITPDIGASSFLGANETRVAGIGPQIGYLFPVGNLQGYINLKGYWEFAAENRASGWNTWVTLSLSPSAAASAPKAMVMK